MSRHFGSKNGQQIKVDRTCEFCGEAFQVYPSVLRKENGGRYCSRSCARRGGAKRVAQKLSGPNNTRWKGGAATYRRRALRHYGARCSQCGYDKYEALVQVHHKNFKSIRDQDDHSLENLEVLCVRCHMERHIERGGSALWVQDMRRLERTLEQERGRIVE